jgi:hypothetical protein
MAKKRRRRSGGKNISLAVAAGFLPTIIQGMKRNNSNGLQSALDEAASGFIGYSSETRDFKLSRMKNGLVPVLAGALVHKLAGRFGINAMLGRAKIPFVRI